uniref:Uncharacterized protein n=1 Tax=Parascaris univalens TaxID=6257 RepID=A0A915A6B6_PARUN
MRREELDRVPAAHHNTLPADATPLHSALRWAGLCRAAAVLARRCTRLNSVPSAASTNAFNTTLVKNDHSVMAGPFDAGQDKLTAIKTLRH